MAKKKATRKSNNRTQIAWRQHKCSEANYRNVVLEHEEQAARIKERDNQVEKLRDRLKLERISSEKQLGRCIEDARLQDGRLEMAHGSHTNEVNRLNKKSAELNTSHLEARTRLSIEVNNLKSENDHLADDVLELKEKLKEKPGLVKALQESLDRSSGRFERAVEDRNMALELLSEMLADQASFFGKQTGKLVMRLSAPTIAADLLQSEKEREEAVDDLKARIVKSCIPHDCANCHDEFARLKYQAFLEAEANCQKNHYDDFEGEDDLRAKIAKLEVELAKKGDK